MSSMVLCADGSVDDSTRSTSLGASSCNNHLWYVDGEHPSDFICQSEMAWSGDLTQAHLLLSSSLP